MFPNRKAFCELCLTFTLMPVVLTILSSSRRPVTERGAPMSKQNPIGRNSRLDSMCFGDMLNVIAVWFVVLTTNPVG